jgi:hypothetical protein
MIYRKEVLILRCNICLEPFTTTNNNPTHFDTTKELKNAVQKSRWTLRVSYAICDRQDPTHTQALTDHYNTHKATP